MVDNIAKQTEELEALQSIYGKKWNQCYNQQDTFSIKITDDIELWITLNDDYPSEKPPSFDIWAPKLNPTQKDLIGKEFEKVYNTNKGSPIIYQWIESLKEIAEAKVDSPKLRAQKNQKSKKTDEIPSQPPEKSVKLEIVHGNAITDRKSTFQGHVCRITHSSQARQLVNELRKNKKISQAKHNILAYHVQNGKEIELNFDEDGEAHSGYRLTYLLEKLNIVNVAVVVTRWYGGIHLGPDRFKHICNAAQSALAKSGFIST